MRRLPPLYALQVFTTVAHEGNMSRAAERLHLTQGAVSRQIALLEEYLGLPVFVRKARGIELSAAGRQLLPAADSAFDGIARAVARLVPRPAELRIRLPPTLAMRWFLPRLADFQRDHSEVDVRISTGTSHHVHFELEDLDAAIYYAKGEAAQRDAVALVEERLTPVCSPTIAALLRHPADLADQVLIHLSADHVDWRDWLALAGVNHPSPDAGPNFEVIDMAVNLAVQGLGVAIADPVLIADDLACGLVVAPFPDISLWTGWRYWYACPRGRLAEPHLAAMSNWLQAEFAQTLEKLAAVERARVG
jgi:LysR family glycine cleavage system transcriptional activator